MISWTFSFLLLVLGPAAESQTPVTDSGSDLYLPSAMSYLPVSDQWATSAAPGGVLVPMPVEIENALLEVNPDSLSDEAMLAAANQSLPGMIDPGRQVELTMADIALDWGVAEIGPGVLAPQGAAMPRRQGGPGGSGGGRGPSAIPFLIVPPPGGNIPPETVPEPISGALWAVVFAGALVLRRRSA